MHDAREGPKAHQHLHLTSAGDHRRAGIDAAHESEHNRLLKALAFDDYVWLLPHLESVRLGFREILVEPEVPLTHAWFIRDGVASIIATEQEGGNVEVGTVGPEGFVGLPILFEDDTLTNRVIIQVEGNAWRIAAGELRRVLHERAGIRRICLRYAAYFTAQLSQSVACNRLHTLEERCARWLLMTHDRVHREAFEITHEFLAFMLGVRRAGVTVAMGTLQGEGIIRYHRGRVTVLDREKLEATSCSCYRITQRALDRLL